MEIQFDHRGIANLEKTMHKEIHDKINDPQIWKELNFHGKEFVWFVKEINTNELICMDDEKIDLSEMKFKSLLDADEGRVVITSKNTIDLDYGKVSMDKKMVFRYKGWFFQKQDWKSFLYFECNFWKNW